MKLNKIVIKEGKKFIEEIKTGKITKRSPYKKEESFERDFNEKKSLDSFNNLLENEDMQKMMNNTYIYDKIAIYETKEK